jgi:predicted transcriptional regulator
MPISVRLKPDLEQLLDKASRRDRRSRSALIHDALTAFLKPQRPKLGAAIRDALANTPRGFGIGREQPLVADKRDWKR